MLQLEINGPSFMFGILRGKLLPAFETSGTDKWKELGRKIIVDTELAVVDFLLSANLPVF